jgi:hypothetical protein
VVDVTLWEAFSVQLMKYISDRKEKGPIVLILTHAQCKLGGSMLFPNFIFNFFPSETNIIKHGTLNCITDNARPNFCNNWSGSKLLINVKNVVVDKFKFAYVQSF